MSMTDPLADAMTQIRNATLRRKSQVALPHSRLKESFMKVLKDEGYIKEYKVIADEAAKERKTLHIYLKYGADGEQVLNRITRVSTPGRRVYRKVGRIEKVLDGMGITILSTPKGLMSDKQAKKQNVGGEVLCRVW